MICAWQLFLLERDLNLVDFLYLPGQLCYITPCLVLPILEFLVEKTAL